MLPTEDWGIYVHIPFCEARCTYCDFNTVTGMGQAEHLRYTKALLGEWQSETVPEGSLASVYFGGGTPSILDPVLIGHVLEALWERLSEPVTAPEVTMEVNPGTVTAQKLASWQDFGVNRLSIGAQAMQNHHLRALNRIHDVSMIRQTVCMAREAGFTNINLDAIYGLPGQTLQEWQETVDGLLHLGPDHLSLYALIVEAGTPLHRAVERGQAELPDPDLVAEMADWAETRLTAMELQPYEISNYARAGYASRHNQLYWRLAPYVALGAGAHAYRPGRRWWNVRGVRRYMDLVEAGVDPLDGYEDLTVDEEMREWLWLGLRLREGVDLRRFFQRFRISASQVFGGVLQELEAKHLLCEDGHALRLTPRGRDLANVVARALVDAPPDMLVQDSRAGDVELKDQSCTGTD
ncbi:MAG: coproporphyrinogen III oxidase [Sulfobacillus acidophilus]|uniref:Heme chaperone HemW n=1 Tax=Sulfobacillus acidophilus TaxID=53633 RepID=A0A2T2WN27_9FIRM|nr:MAG: coproporphyrinogen III oxidase [Sulfobacillus acidophilus]